MDVQTVTLFLALLAVATQIFTVSTLAMAVGSAMSERIGRVFGSYLDNLAPHALSVALGIATTATLGSLYFSEVAHFIPCELCWYQRIAMYPLVPILAIALWRKDFNVAPYVASVASIGGAISIYHMAVERMPALGGGACDPTNPCSVIWVNRFGYLTIPTMALSGFAAIALLALIAYSRRNIGDVEDEPKTSPDREELSA